MKIYLIPGAKTYLGFQTIDKSLQFNLNINNTARDIKLRMEIHVREALKITQYFLASPGHAHLPKKVVIKNPKACTILLTFSCNLIWQDTVISNCSERGKQRGGRKSHHPETQTHREGSAG